MQCPYIFTFCFFIFLCFFRYFLFRFFLFLLSAFCWASFVFRWCCILMHWFLVLLLLHCHYIWNLNLDLILLVISLISIERPLIRNAFVSFCFAQIGVDRLHFLKCFSVFMDSKDFSLYQFFSLCSECVAYNLNCMCVYQFGTSLVRCTNRVRRTHTPKPCVLHMQTAYISIKTPRCHWIEQNPFQQLHSHIFPNNKLKKKSQRKTRNENTTKR